MAEQLGELVAAAGGAAQAFHLLAPLQRLACVEEAVVRDKAVSSLGAIAACMPPGPAEVGGASGHWLPLLLELKAHEYFTARISACALCRVGLEKLAAGERACVRDAFAKLCGDDTPMVRRVAAAELGRFALALASLEGDDAGSGAGGGGSSHAVSPAVATRRVGPLLPLFSELAADEQDSVRLQTAGNCVSLGKLFAGPSATDGAAAETAAAVLEAQHGGPGTAVAPVGGAGDEAGDAGEAAARAALGRVVLAAVKCGADPSWRVRWSAVSQFDAVVGSLGPAPRLLSCFVGLLGDAEAEVRTAGAGAVARFGGLLPAAALLEQVLPAAAALADDPSEHVRAALASCAAGLAPALGRDHTISRLLPVLLQLLRDTNAEVRLNVISQLGQINAVIGVDLLAQSLLPTILELARDGKWRVRGAILERMPLLAEQLGAAFFNERLSGQCVAWLHDDVFTVRAAAAANLTALTAHFGPEWAVHRLVPQLTAMAKRGGTLPARGSAAAAAGGGEAKDADASMGGDAGGGGGSVTDGSPVEHPSMHRMMALRTLLALAPALGSDALVRAHVLPTAVLLAADPVPNIRINAARALEALAAAVGPAAVASDVAPALRGMLRDADRDVQYFAQRALANLGA